MKFKVIKRQLRRPFEVATCMLLFAFIRFLPFSWVRFLARCLGRLLYLIPSQRKLVMSNLELAFPHKSLLEKKSLARQSMSNMVMTFMEQIWFDNNEKRQKEYLSLSPEVQKKLSDLEESEQPILFLALHIGNWEFTSLTVKRYSKRPLRVVANRVKNLWLNKWIVKSREFTGVEVLFEQGAVKGLLQTLRKKGNVGLLVDQNTPVDKGGTYANLFGLPVTISRTPAMLSRKFNARVVIMSCLRTKTGFDYSLKVLPKQPEEFVNDESLTQEFLTQMEIEICDNPESWVWMYKRWNYIPKNQPHLQELYPYYARLDHN